MLQVVAETNDIFGVPRRPPARLAKLEKRKKKKKAMTQEEIERKLARAEQRRKVSLTALRSAVSSPLLKGQVVKTFTSSSRIQLTFVGFVCEHRG